MESDSSLGISIQPLFERRELPNAFGHGFKKKVQCAVGVISKPDLVVDEKTAIS